ncbi:MAG: selenoneine biosynthesis selenosugar synthase SenB [Planctomycetota bacterium]|nr:selenoneine biosynthesis selenosugar synthase SenB [Planctomycetota bacterium]
MRERRVQIVIPAQAGRRSGNQVTAIRWRRMLEGLGHRVRVESTCTDDPCDLLIALHAHRSADAALLYRRRNPSGKLVVALSGTDLYRDLQKYQAGHDALAVADRVVVLQKHGLTQLDPGLHPRCRVIHQSVVVPSRLPPKAVRSWQVAVVGHLRTVKDPFLAARAVRSLPCGSRIRVVHLGAALSDSMQKRAEAETRKDPRRYQWLGNRPHWEVMRQLARSQAMVLSSRMEGGANVVGESISVGTPVISTRISGSIGLLGDDYPGFYEPGDVVGLRKLLVESEKGGEFYKRLVRRCEQLRSVFEPKTESAAWRQLLAELFSSASIEAAVSA